MSLTRREFRNLIAVAVAAAPVPGLLVVELARAWPSTPLRPNRKLNTGVRYPGL